MGRASYHLLMRPRPDHRRVSALTRRDLLRAGALGAAGLAAGLGGCGEPAFAPLVPVEAWDHAFVNVNVVPMDSERVVPNQTVGIAGGRIVGIGPAAEIDLPTRVRQIAGRDGYLMPGLADMHVHTSPAPSSISDVPAEARPLFSHQWMPYVASGVTTVRNMSGSLGHPEFNQFVQSEELVAPTLHTTGPLIDGFPPTWPSATVVRTPEEAVEEVQAQQQSGYAFIKVYDELLPEVYDAIVTTARDLNIPVVGHTPWHAGLEHCLAAKQSSIEHLWGYLLAAASEDLSVHKGYMPEEYVRAFDPSRVSRLAELTAAAGTWNCPTLVMWQRFYAREDVEQLLQRPEVRFVHPSMRRYWEMFVFARDRESRSRADQARKTIVKAIARCRRTIAAWHGRGGCIRRTRVCHSR